VTSASTAAFTRVATRMRRLEAELEDAKPLLALLAPALAACCDPSWALDVGAGDPIDSAAALEGRTLVVRATDVTAATARIVPAVLGRRPSCDPAALLEASIASRTAAIETLLELGAAEAGRAAAIALVLPMPWLHAARRKLAADVASWRGDGCPICGAWPVLAELRGLERARWLGCNRCGTSWPSLPMRCPFCGMTEEARLGELLPAEHADARRVDVCRACKGYIKTISTLGPIAPEEIALEDVATMHMDAAALERGFERPAPRGPCVRVVLS
jgi:hypothetical protein